MHLAKATIRLTIIILEAIVLDVMPYHSSKSGFPIRAKDTSENNQNEFNLSVLTLILLGQLSSCTVLVS